MGIKTLKKTATNIGLYASCAEYCNISYLHSYHKRDVGVAKRRGAAFRCMPAPFLNLPNCVIRVNVGYCFWPYVY
jgi:hypothetical protein